MRRSASKRRRPLLMRVVNLVRTIFFRKPTLSFSLHIGMQINDKPRTTWFNSQGAIEDALVDAARDKPTLIVTILPMNATHVYNKLKQ